MAYLEFTGFGNESQPDEPTAILDTERASQVVKTFASLIHENQRAGIPITHDLRMCEFVDKVFQMRDG